MPPRIAFSFSAEDVAAGVRERTSAATASEALREIRATPLVQPRHVIAQTATRIPSAIQPSSFAPLRFVPAPTPDIASTSARAPPLTFATMLGTRPRPLACTLPNCDDPFHKHRTSPLPLLPSEPVVEPAPTGMLPSRSCRKDVNPDENQCADQYSIRPLSKKRGFARFLEVLHGVLISNKLDPNCAAQAPDKRISHLLGPTGHIERFSAWSHIAGAVLFLVYAVVRTAVAEADTPAGFSASVAAFGVVVTMLSSAVYHGTAPDQEISVVGRFLDYSSIYIGLVTTAVADIAVATDSFKNVPDIAIADIPVAGGVILLFFLWRRIRIPSSKTWARDASLGDVNAEPCSLGRGLFKMQHFDLHHSQLRYATSVLLTAGYFAFAPAAFSTFSGENVAIILSLQGAGFFVLSFGMYIDRVLMWPDKLLVKYDREGSPLAGVLQCFRCQPCGCVATAHASWHIVAIVSIALTCFAREYALVSIDRP